MTIKRINEVCTINPKGTLDSFTGSEISFIPMEAVSTSGEISTDKTICIDRVKNYTVFRNGDILFAKITPCMENGKGAIATNLFNGYGAGSTEFIVLRPDIQQVTAKWVQLYLSQKVFRLFCQQHMTGSAGQKRVPAKFLSNCNIPIPPLDEQKRIVARIEKLFSELDKAVETLQKTKQQLAVYRQAVLKEAFSNHWPLHTTEELCYFITKGTTPPKNKQLSMGEIPYIKVYNLTFNTSLDFSIDPTYVSYETHAGFLSRSIVFPGDVLMNIVGPPMGKVSIVPDTYKEWNINQAITRFRCKENLYNKYLAYFLSFSKTVEKMKSKAKATAGQFNLTLEICRNIEIPLPPMERQRKIVADIESRLSVCDSIEKTVDTTLQQAESMCQSILKQAFEGDL